MRRRLALVVSNVWVKRVRSLLTAVAVAVGVGTVLTLGVVTDSLRSSAAGILQVGKADFTVAQRGAADIINSVLTEKQVAAVGRVPGVRSAIGVLLDTEKLNDDNPLFIEIGIAPEALSPFGVHILRGRPFAADAPDEMLLGWRIADQLGINPGDTLQVAGGTKTVVGTFSTGNAFGDSAGMFPIVPFQAWERQPSGLSLAFVRVEPGTPHSVVEHRVAAEFPNLATIRNLADFGRADRNYEFIKTADEAATIIAVFVGALVVANAMLLSLIERTREFGVLRSLGWSRWQLVALIMSEALVISVAGAALGVVLAVGATQLLTHVSSFQGVLEPDYQAGIFGRALITAAVVGFLGAAYPAIRVSFLSPMEALRRE
jgi:putative ABC transport system permease protein